MKKTSVLCLCSALVLMPFSLGMANPHLALQIRQESPDASQDSGSESIWSNPGLIKTSNFVLTGYEVQNSQNQPLAEWYPNEKAAVKAVFRNTKLKTSDVITDWESFDPKKPVEFLEAFIEAGAFVSGSKAKVYVVSSLEEPLMIQVLWESVTWTGGSSSLEAEIAYEGLDEYAQKLSFSVSQVREKEEEKEPDSQPETDISDSVTEPSDYDGGYSYTYDSGSSSRIVQTATPHLIVSQYSYGGKSVTAGDTFELDIQFTNTSKTLGVENILMSLQTEDGLSIANSSNTFYFDSLAPQGKLSQKVAMKALGSDKSSSPTITVNFTYEYVDNDTRTEKTGSETISIPVIQKDRFEVTEAVITDLVQTGSETVLSFPYVNKGKGTLYNVAVKVDGDMETLMAVQNLGNFDSGKSGTIDVVLTPQTSGSRTFKVVISYENANEEVLTKEYKYTVDVMDYQMEESMDSEDLYPEEEVTDSNTSSFSWGWLWIVLILAAGIGAWYWLKKKKKKEEKALDTDEETFDFEQDWNPKEEAAEENSSSQPQALENGEDSGHETR